VEDEEGDGKGKGRDDIAHRCKRKYSRLAYKGRTLCEMIWKRAGAKKIFKRRGKNLQQKRGKCDNKLFTVSERGCRATGRMKGVQGQGDPEKPYYKRKRLDGGGKGNMGRGGEEGWQKVVT